MYNYSTTSDVIEASYATFSTAPQSFSTSIIGANRVILLVVPNEFASVTDELLDSVIETLKSKALETTSRDVVCEVKRLSKYGYAVFLFSKEVN
jgi:hypothetical protein